MDIEKRLEDGILFLGLAGDFDTTETDAFSAEISEAVDAGNFRVLLDLRRLEFVNSTALGALLRAQKRLGQYGGGLASAGAPADVARTFRILQLDKRIPLHETVEEAAAYLRTLGPESVSAAGEEVAFLVKGSEASFGSRPRRARMEEIHEEGMTISFQNLEALNPDACFPPQAVVSLQFRLPLYHPTHVFQAEATIDRAEQLGRETIHVHLVFTALSDPEREGIRQYVSDLRFLKE